MTESQLAPNIEKGMPKRLFNKQMSNLTLSTIDKNEYSDDFEDEFEKSLKSMISQTYSNDFDDEEFSMSRSVKFSAPNNNHDLFDNAQVDENLPPHPMNQQFLREVAFELRNIQSTQVFNNFLSYLNI